MLPVVSIFRAGLYAAGGSCGKFGMASGGGMAPFVIPRGPCGFDGTEVVRDSASKDIRPPV